MAFNPLSRLVTRLDMDRGTLHSGLNQAKGSVAAAMAAMARSTATTNAQLSRMNTTLLGLQRTSQRVSEAISDGWKTLGGVTAGKFTQQLIDAGRQYDNIISIMGVSQGTLQQSEAAFVAQSVEAQRLGVSLQSLTEQYGKAQAGAKGTALAGKGTDDIFKALSETSAVLSLGQEKFTGIMNAVTQIMAKGKVQAEELRGQLGDRLVGAFYLAAEAMGVTTTQLDDMLEKGLVPAEKFIPNLARVLREQFGSQVPGAIKRSGAEIERFKNGIFLLQVSFAKSGFMEGFVSGLERLRVVMESPGFQQGARNLSETLGGMMASLAENGDTVMKVLAALGGARLGLAAAGAMGGLGKTAALPLAIGGGAAALYAASQGGGGSSASEELEKQTIAGKVVIAQRGLLTTLAAEHNREMGKAIELNQRIAAVQREVAAQEESVAAARAKADAVRNDEVYAQRRAQLEGELGKLREETGKLQEIRERAIKAPKGDEQTQLFEEYQGRSAQLLEQRMEKERELRDISAEHTYELNQANHALDVQLRVLGTIAGTFPTHVAERWKASLEDSTKAIVKIREQMQAIQAEQAMDTAVNDSLARIVQAAEVKKRFQSEQKAWMEQQMAAEDKLREKNRPLIEQETAALQDQQKVADAARQALTKRDRAVYERAQKQAEIEKKLRAMGPAVEAPEYRKLLEDQAALQMETDKYLDQLSKMEEQSGKTATAQRELAERQGDATKQTIEATRQMIVLNRYFGEAASGSGESELAQIAVKGGQYIDQQTGKVIELTRNYTSAYDAVEDMGDAIRQAMELQFDLNSAAGKEFVQRVATENYMKRAIDERRKARDEEEAAAERLQRRMDAIAERVSRRRATPEAAMAQNMRDLQTWIDREAAAGRAVPEGDVEFARGDIMRQFEQDSREALRNSKAWTDGAKLAFLDYESSATNAAATAAQAFQSSMQLAEDSIVQMALTGKFEVKDMVTSWLADIARLAVRQGITGPLAGFIASLFGGGTAATPAATAATSFDPGSFAPNIFGEVAVGHTGIGRGGISTRRRVSAMTMAGAPRLHSGLASDEFPAILQKGETVIPRGMSMGGGGTVVKQSVRIDARGAMDPYLLGRLRREMLDVSASALDTSRRRSLSGRVIA